MATAPDAEARFHACLAETLKWEGGYSNEKYDPGGAGVVINIPVKIDAPGADAAALKRVEAAVSKLGNDLRPTTLATVRDARNRNLA